MSRQAILHENTAAFKERYLPIVGLALPIIIWYVITNLGLLGPLLSVSPEKILVKFVELWFNGEIIDDTLLTLYRVFTGFAIAAIISIPVGILMGYYQLLYKMFQHWIHFLRSLSAISVFPVFLLLFSVGDGSKIAVIAFGCGFIILINVIFGLLHSSKATILYAQTVGFSNLQILRKVALFESLPGIFVGAKQAMAIALILGIAVEMFVGTNVGLGQMIFNSHLTYRIPEMFAVILWVGILGIGFNAILSKIEKKVLHWVDKS
jgi:NitT/TauT family transport system permease protein